MPKWYFYLFEDKIGNEIQEQTKIFNRWVKKDRVVYSVSSSIDVMSLQIKYKKPITYQQTQYSRLVTVFDQPLKSVPFQTTKGLLLGNTLNGLKSLKLNEELNHVLLCGCSGAGKTSACQVIILNLILQGVTVWVHSNKKSMDYDLFAKHCRVSKGVEQFSELLGLIEKKMEEREESKSNPPLVVVIDEVFAIKTYDKKLYDRLAVILSTSRSFNIHIIILTQRSTVEVLPATITSHCSVRLSLQTSTPQESINLIHVPDSYFLTQKGHGYLCINGRLEEIKTFHLNTTEIERLLPPVNVIVEKEVKPKVKSYIIGGNLDGSYREGQTNV